MIKESNWARASLGTQVIEVSHEATHLSSSATNLLLEQEDALWVAGEAPQHVMLKLPAAHPPLRYAGWHVWHDYVTNPQLVEVSSGETTDRLTAMHLCRALPGAGTQIWKLTQPIPAHHVYVRYKILQSFGPGPTYMNSIVLLASDPGPRYRSNPNSPKATVAGAFTSTPPNRNPSSATESPGIRIPPAPPVMHTTTTTTTATEQFSSTNRQGASTLYQDACSPHVDGVYANQQHQRRDQGFVVAEQHGRAVGTTLSYANNVSDSSSRLSQLLQDLDEDIRLLKPIKSVTANTTDWRYVPDGGSTTLLIADGVPDESQTTQTPSHFRRGSTSVEKKVRAQRVTEVEEEEEEEEQSGRHASHRRSSRQRRTPHDRSSSHDHMRSTSSSARHPRRSHHRHSSSRHRHESAPGEGRLTAAHSESHRSHGHGSGFMAPPCHHVEDVALRHRLTSLEQHVATLTQTMDAQQEDLSTIKRLLVHQAMLERQRTTAQAAQVADSPSGTVGGAQPPSMEDTRKGKTETTQAPPSPSTVDITFPEPALRGFVESLMAHKLHKYFRKSEAKYLRRVDAHLHDIVTAFSQAVDDRVQAHLGVPPSLDYGYAPLTYAPPATAPPPAPAPAPVVLPHHLGCPDVAALQPPPVAARLPAGQRAYRPASVPPPPRPSEAMCTPHTSSGPYAPHPAPAYAVYTPPGGVLEGHGVSTPSAHQYNFVSPNPNGFRPSSSRGSIPISIIRTSSEQAYAAATAA